MVIAQTERLTLRQAKKSDAKALHTVFGNSEVMQFGEGPQGIEWVYSWIEQAKRSYDFHGYGLWVIDLSGHTDAIGYCGLTWFPNINGQPETEIGYRLSRNHWNQGLGTEAAMAVRNVAFSHFDLSRLIALIAPDNTRSIRVAEKLGMAYDGAVMLEGYSHPDFVYACSRNVLV